MLGVTRSFSVKGFHRKTVFSRSKLIEMETVKLIENEYIHDRSGDVPVIYFLFLHSYEYILLILSILFSPSQEHSLLFWSNQHN